MNITIQFSNATVKALTHQLHLAFRDGDLRRIKRISALLLLADHQGVSRIALRLGAVAKRSTPGCMPLFWPDAPACAIAVRLGDQPN